MFAILIYFPVFIIFKLCCYFCHIILSSTELVKMNMIFNNHCISLRYVVIFAI
jgi:hypothetical protein